MGQVVMSNAQFEIAREKLKAFVAIPSVSNTGSCDYSMINLDRAANFAGAELEELGFEVRYERINGSPQFILAQRVADASWPTILLYAHYDVQPVDREQWDTEDPFTVVEQDGRLYGRGASDDKAGIIVITSAIRMLQENGKLSNVNLKVLFEGEEEFGSGNMGALLEQEKDVLDADALIVMDGANKDIYTGTLENSTRGVLTMAIRVDALTQSVHSGTGCLAPDPAMELVGLLHSLRDLRAIEGFMDDCIPLGEEEAIQLAANSQTAEEYANEVHALPGTRLRGDPSISIYERIVQEPSVSIVNMTAGQPNGGNSIQAFAEATVGIRLTPGQTPQKIEQIIRRHLDNQPKLYGLNYTLTSHGIAVPAWKADPTKPFAAKYLEALEKSYGKTAVVPTGGTLPLFADFEQTFPKMEMLVVGVEDPDTNAHSHNESQDLSILRNATNSLATFIFSVGV